MVYYKNVVFFPIKLAVFLASSAAYMEKVGERIIETGKNQAKKRGLENVKTAVLLGDSTEKILESAAANEIDIIIMGSRGLGEIKSLFLGSVSGKVCNAAECTCITVK